MTYDARQEGKDGHYDVRANADFSQPGSDPTICALKQIQHTGECDCDAPAAKPECGIIQCVEKTKGSEHVKHTEGGDRPTDDRIQFFQAGD